MWRPVLIMKDVSYSLFIILFLMTSCFEAAKNNRLDNKFDTNINGGTTKIGPDGKPISGNNISFGGDDGETIAKVEIRHLIEPKVDDSSNGGEHKRKLTIPKNYNGLLYLAGINISSLTESNILVRFKFGTDLSAITIPATISTGPGLTPQTNVEVLILDMASKPFEDVQLLYELYDYNNYDFTGTGSDPSALINPVDFNRDDKLFCRGLKLKNDNTFTGNIASGCRNSSDTCKYAYAKVVDKGLIESGTLDIPIIPSEKNIQRTNIDYHDDDNETKLARCLPDNPDLTGGMYTFDLTNTFNGLESSVLIDSKLYIFKGPYRSINDAKWEISSNAMTGTFGLFKKIPDFNNNGKLDSSELQYAQQSLLFPLYTQFNLTKDTQFMGSNNPNDVKVLTEMPNTGDSTFMDGCNARVSTVDDITGENIGSCNVTATIEIIAISDEDGSETIIDVTDEVKLQLVKPSFLNTSGDNVLLSSFEQCSSSSQCGSDSCCINKRCWSKSIVSQCIEDLPSFGNQETGDSCISDYQCSSLCCNKIDGRCAPHDTLADNPSFCSKPTGQSCVSKEFCQKHPVTTCMIIDTGLDQFGGRTCALRCITAEVFGECSAGDGSGVGVCVPPATCPQPSFDPNSPTRCTDVELRTFAELKSAANNPSQCL